MEAPLPGFVDHVRSGFQGIGGQRFRHGVMQTQLQSGMPQVAVQAARRQSALLEHTVVERNKGLGGKSSVPGEALAGLVYLRRLPDRQR